MPDSNATRPRSASEKVLSPALRREGTNIGPFRSKSKSKKVLLASLLGLFYASLAWILTPERSNVSSFGEYFIFFVLDIFLAFSGDISRRIFFDFLGKKMGGNLNFAEIAKYS